MNKDKTPTNQLKFGFNHLITSKQIINFGWTIVLLVVLSPALMTGFFGDDIFLSTVNGYAIFFDSSVFDLAINFSKVQMTENGRFLPLISRPYLIFWMFNDVIFYKTYLLIMSALSVCVFYYFIKSLTQNRLIAVCFLALISTFFQFRHFHDPIVAYHGLVQTVFILMTLSWSFFLKFIRTKAIMLNYLSALLFLVSALMYEVTYPFILVIIFLAIYYGSDHSYFNRLKALLPHLIVLMIVTLGSIYVRELANIPLYGADTSHSIKLSGLSYILTVFKHIFGTLPLSYFVTSLVGRELLPAEILSTILLFVICRTLINRTIGEISSKAFLTIKLRPLVILGSLILFLPIVLIALSPQHSREIEWGLAYIPVFISYFGAALIASALMLYWLQQSKSQSWNKTLTIVSTVLPLFISLTFLSNLLTARQSLHSTFVPYKRNFIEKAFSNGKLCEFLGENPIIILRHANNWDLPSFYSGLCNKKVELINSFQASNPFIQDVRIETVLDSSPSNSNRVVKNVFYLNYEVNSLDHGHLVIGRLDSLSFKNEKEITGVAGRELIIYHHSNLGDLNGHFKFLVDELSEADLKFKSRKIILQKDLLTLYQKQ